MNALRRTGQARQTPPSFWRTPRRRIRWRAYPSGASRRDWVQTLVTALPSIVAAIALIFTWRTVNATNSQLQTNLQGQITDRYNAAITNLGSSSMDVRLGGIYALQRIMQDSPRDQPTVVAVLCAFVRDHASVTVIKPAHSSPNTSPTSSGHPAIDIQAALTVVGIRNIANDGPAVVDFTGANLTGANLAHADFYRSIMMDANLSGVDLTNARLGGADLYHVNFTKATIFGTDLTGAVAQHSELRGAGFVAANLSHADFSDSNFTGATFYQANLTDAVFSGANLTGVNLKTSKVTGAKGLRTASP